jgi:hypothetical protein
MRSSTIRCGPMELLDSLVEARLLLGRRSCNCDWEVAHNPIGRRPIH